MPNAWPGKSERKIVIYLKLRTVFLPVIHLALYPPDWCKVNKLKQSCDGPGSARCRSLSTTISSSPHFITS